ncbi:glycosyl hydrolase [Streptomyces sp. e14]|nr:glycosyl hydrolase [Streptomyces sp. e14]
MLRRAPPAHPAPRRPGLGRHRAGPAGERAPAGTNRRPARRPPRLRRAARADHPRRRHGRRGHHQPARTRRGRPQLRLPVRVDPRPELRRTGPPPLPGAPELLDAAVHFVGERLRSDGPRLAPAYTVHGRPVPDQRELGLPGYPGGSSRIGNHVGEQFQLDAFGESLLLFAAAERAGRLDAEGWKAADLAVRTVADRWREPDAGIWELEPRQWTHSRLTCVAGLRALAGAAPRQPLAGTCERLADTLFAEACATAVHPDGHWQRATDDPGIDAALLLPALRGALPARDPRTRATLAACRAHLTQDHFVYRFRHDDRPLEQAEGAFVLCGFVMALAEHQQGNDTEAYRWFERSRGACGASGLYAEEFDIAQRQLRGNLPQAFVHALLLESAARLAPPSAPTAE